MQHQTAPGRGGMWAVLVATAVVPLVAGLVLRHGAPSSRPKAQGAPTPTWEPTSTPEPPVTPLYTAEEAIAHTLAHFPQGHNPHGIVARLITHRTLQEWFEAPSPLPEESPEPTETWSPPAYHPDHPVWLVAVLGDNLTDVDILPIMGAFPGMTPVPVIGAYYAWDANSRGWSGQGTLTSEEYAAIIALANEEVQIVPATEPPAYGVLYDTPTPW